MRPFLSSFRAAGAALQRLSFAAVSLCLLAASSLAAAPAAELIASPESGWPQFRGPRRDGISEEKGLLKAWPEAGPKERWSITGVGRGFSSPVIVGDRIYLTGDVGDAAHVFALDLAGKRIWQTPNGAAWKENYPGARATVAYRAGRIYHQNAHGRTVCLNAEDGKELWAVDLLAQFKGKNITWALSECVLVDEKAVYLTAGGADALVVALHPETGKLLWKSAALQDPEDGAVENASYVSPILVRFAGRRLLIGSSLRNLYCLDADSGALQWTHRFPTSYSVLAMMPILVNDGVFMTAPHGRGGRLLKLVAPAGKDAPVGKEEAWSTNLDTCQGGALFVDGRIIGSYYGPRKGWAAVDPASGKVLYSAPEIIKGAAIHADERLYILSEDGWMRLVEPTADAFQVHGKFRFAEPKNDAWAHPVILNGLLYLRYHDRLACFDIRENAPASE